MLGSRVFIGPNEIAGQYRNLAIALRKAGVDCNYYTFYENQFKYGGDIGTDGFPRIMRGINTIGKQSNIIVRVISILFFDFIRIVFFIKCLLRYDVYIFGYGFSLLRWNLDLPVLKFFNKLIIANLSHGSDMTPAYLDGALLNENREMPSMHKQFSIVRKQLRMVRAFEKYADVIIGSPLSSSYLAQRDYLDVIKIGRLCQAQFVDISRNNKYAIGAKIKIVHAPSHSPGKGSHIIREIIGKILIDNSNVEYIELTGVDNEYVLEHLKSATLLIDQVFSDLPLSGLGMEAMVHGVPVLLSGYALERLKNCYKEEIFPPVILTNPDDLEDKLNYILSNAEMLNEYSTKGLSFIESYWSPTEVAKKYIDIIQGTIDESCLHNPSNFLYVHGYGMSRNLLIKNLANYIKLNGFEGLHIAKRPALKNAILELIAEGK